MLESGEALTQLRIPTSVTQHPAKQFCNSLPFLHIPLQTFNAFFQSNLDQTCATLISEISSWRSAVEARFQSRFQAVEDIINGPYNKDLNWEWLQMDTDGELAECLAGMRVRLKEDPDLELSAAEYFEKYARGSLAILKILSEAGYFTPPPNKFFLSFCKQLFAGEKTLLRDCEVQKVYVPPDQVDLAFLRTQELVAKEPALQRYFPSGSPILRIDKEFYLHVVNTLHGLPYTVVQPLTQTELDIVTQVKSALQSVDKHTALSKVTQPLTVFQRTVSGLRPVEAEEVTRLWRLIEEAQIGG